MSTPSPELMSAHVSSGTVDEFLPLLDAAARADLLVVGTRGHGGFTGLLLGSVSQQCAHHSPCPIAIIPAHKES